MRYQPISKEFYQKTRIKFSKNMKPNTMAVFFSNEEPYRTADTYYSYRQQSDLFYLTGIDQEKTILVLFPDAHEEKYREILFVRKTSKEIAIREGNKLTIDQVKNQSGIQTVMYLETFDRIFHFLTNFCSGIYCNLNENMRALPTWDLNRKMVDELKNKYPLHQFYRSGPLLKKLRMVKSSEEVSMIQKACNITGKAFDRILRSVEPGMMEYQIEAEMTHEFLWNGSSGHAYTPIVASGYNACVLHYVENNNQCNDGDLLLMDFGSEYGNYASDCSRTIPVNGKFSKRQATIYNTVLYVQKAAMNLLVPGKQLHNIIRKLEK